MAYGARRGRDRDPGPVRMHPSRPDIARRDIARRDITGRDITGAGTVCDDACGLGRGGWCR